MRRPLIGLPGRRKRIGDLTGWPTALGELHFDMYFADYASSVWAAGGLPAHLPVGVDPSEWVHHLDGLVLTGGADVDPARYGQQNTASDVEPERDTIEFALLDAALADAIPVLGICRGFQVVNVAAGGTLHQDVPSHARYDLDPATEVHELTLVPGSRVHAMFGDTHRVNSLHHQTVDRVGSGLTVTATAEDGTPEAIESDDGQVLAVQWHPEMMNHHDPTFRWLVAASHA